VIVADTGAVLALLEPSDPHHAALAAAYDARPEAWVLPWAILAEVDHLLPRLGPHMPAAFLDDLADGRWQVWWGGDQEVNRARDLARRYAALSFGLVDGIVMAVAELQRAEAIATLDLRHFGAVELQGKPRLLPRDL
jgi:hypothetical protein